ncbi:MAG: carbon-nitrogen hydrolase [Balneolaceae bacterium]
MTYTLALLQMTANEQKNVQEELLLDRIREAARKGATVICLQELSNTLYFCKDHKTDIPSLAETIPGPYTDKLCKLARELKVVLVAPFVERSLPGVYYNSLVVIDRDGSLLGTYRKMHIPDDPGFHEKFYFRRGNLGYKVFDTSVGKIGTLICWDQWFPEAARITALMGAELILYPTAIGTLKHETSEERAAFRDAWRTIQRGHAISNGVFVAGVNRTGIEDGTSFWGGSFICSPFGTLLAEADEQECILMADIDRSQVEQVRLTWPFLRDRRTDSYSGLLD